MSGRRFYYGICPLHGVTVDLPGFDPKISRFPFCACGQMLTVFRVDGPADAAPEAMPAGSAGERAVSA